MGGHDRLQDRCANRGSAWHESLMVLKQISLPCRVYLLCWNNETTVREMKVPEYKLN
jgi:hypothetical protein